MMSNKVKSIIIKRLRHEWVTEQAFIIKET